jgi:hypothetical protein
MTSEQTISLTFVRDRIKSFYDIVDTKLDAFIDLKILDSVRDMYSHKYQTQECYTLDICDCKAELPCNFLKILAIVTPCGTDETPMIYSDFVFDGVKGNYQLKNIPNRWKIMGNYLVFPSNFAFDSIDIYCNVMKLDDEGFPILIKDHVLYYEFYASYWLGQKLKDPRVAAFVNPRSGKPKYIGARTAIIHNEQTMQFDYDKFAIAALNRSLQGASFRYYGAYGTQANVYQWGL